MPILIMRNYVVCIVLLASSMAGLAAPPTAESVATLLAVTGTETMLDAIYSNMEQSMQRGMAQAARGHVVTAEQQRFLDAAPKQFASVMRTELSWPSLQPMYVRIYQDTFTQEEVDGLIAFYRSPPGEAFVAKMPQVMQRVTVDLQSRIGPITEKMQAAMRKALADAKINQ